MKSITAACAAIFFASAAYAEKTVDCADVISMTDNLNPIMDTLNGITRWCIDGRAADPACQELGQLMEANSFSERSTTVAVWMLNFGMQCAGEDSE